MKIAMIGHKDFPCRSGGVEVVVYELATRLAQKGEQITVYNRGKRKGSNHYTELGVENIRSATFKKQSLNAMVYSFTATFNALFKKYDIVHYHAIGPSVPLLLAHICGKKTVSTVHGLNWRVDKWNSFASKYLKLGEKIAAKYADEVITLSEEMHRYFLDTYSRDTKLIENAVTPIPETSDDILKEKLGVERDSYILYIGRISPEKGPQDLIEAYSKLDVDEKLVIAGEIPDNEFGDLISMLIKDNPKILTPGFVSGEYMNALYSNAALYVLPSHTEGLALTLLEAMSCGCRCLVSDIVENTSVLGDFGRTFKVSNIDSLAENLADCLGNKEQFSKKESEIAFVKEKYSYDRVVEEHLDVYRRIAEKN